MSDVIAALTLLVTIFGAGWGAYQDSGRWRRLERYGNAVQAAQQGSLERTTLQSVFDRLALPLALEALAPARRSLGRRAWITISVGLVIEAAWAFMIIVDQRGWAAWTTYGAGLAVLGTGVMLRAAWRELRQRWMREEMHRRHELIQRNQSSGAHTRVRDNPRSGDA